MSRRKSLIADQRGAASFEMLVVFFFLMFSLLLPLADVAIAGFRFISAWQALRGFGQYLQYYNPLGPDGSVTWRGALPTSFAGYSIRDIKVICGDAGAACSGPPIANIASPKYFTFSTTVKLAPFVLKAVLCPTSCTYPLTYSERFQ
jgi:hypothetical protein